ncbi:arylsulfatase [Fulvivirgaceae bacterium BMA12]|uniref:Arylsulfatase n=1 Tax=Agaribacillus aureus TaxID=3051825 RepID=A0ABT8LAA3_9BACT|nr:arylsulfatase [Fulvivirgaceae bacterium BMA12]
MRPYTRWALHFLLILLVTVVSVPLTRALQRPNVILIMTDDQGYGDLSCHGNPYLETPNLDKLHAQAVRFTDFHVDPTCAPTRAALMTGKYAHHVGVWHTVSGGNHLRASEITMADVFKSSGYKTGIFGKWHLGSNYPYRPMDRGFDEWLGQGDGGTGTTDDWFDNDRVNDYYWHNGQREQINGFAPDVFYDAAIDFMRENKRNNKPFFIYLPTYLPHHPHTLPDTAWAENANSKVSKYVSYFFAGIKRIDRNIGKLRKALDASGASENTILIFMSDNGGTAGVKLFNAGMRGRKGQVYDGGHRVPFFIHWPNGKLKHGSDVNDLTSHIDVLPTLIDLCKLKVDQALAFDGRSFREQLIKPALSLPERTLFVETQRTHTSKRWVKTAGMTNRWRLIDNTELYDMENDPGQTSNVIDKFPEVATKIRQEHERYWSKVTPADRDQPRFIIGHPNDPETFLTPSDWYLPDVPWNHAQVAAGSPHAGAWQIAAAKDGVYRFEIRRWPREANAHIRGIPDFEYKATDAWNASGGVKRLIYGDQMVALPVRSIKLDVGAYSRIKTINEDDTNAVFEVPMKAGNTQVKGVMLDRDGKVIGGAYYVYVTRLKDL